MKYVLLFILQIEIIIYYDNMLKIESFDNRLQKSNQYLLYYIKISNKKQFLKKSLRSQNYKYEKDNKITIYSFHVHEYF